MPLSTPNRNQQAVAKTFPGKVSKLIGQHHQHSKTTFFIISFRASLPKDALMAKTIVDTLRDAKIRNLHPKRPIYTEQLCRMRYAYDKSRTRVFFL